jgi:hypothetical protein
MGVSGSASRPGRALPPGKGPRSQKLYCLSYRGCIIIIIIIIGVVIPSHILIPLVRF